MKNCLAFLLCMLMLSLHAQIVINEEHMPAEGDVFSFATTVDAGANDHALTGQGMVWDYSALQALAFDADTFVSVTSTPFAYQFFFNNGFLYPDHNATCALAQPDVDLGFVSFSESFSFYKVDEDGFREVGFGGNVNGIPSSVRSIPIDWVYELPMHYGDAFSGYSASEIDILGIGSFYGEQDRTTEVEGWGTLILPDASYEVLKLKVTINSVDSLYSIALGQGFSFVQEEQVTYKWVAQEEVLPVLEVSLNDFGLATARFRSENLVDGVLEFQQEGLRAYPNPAQYQVRINMTDVFNYQVWMTDLTGREIKCDALQDTHGVTFHIEGLNKGLYMIHVSDGQRRWTEKIMVD